ncbi:Cthe_2314 family HEPN domain-containing protein [Devosia rhodophyticola]|uniref:Cthe_2314 family HEPN domain-containing protein n=1 Tax=Devosia rhodophyticola TaxID=3026423 RepID=A0ABY7YZ65_9HYPH|nr:Cthe_2314 family HEPN domain-containing protein [Devosia rhodophyticola]WDR06683.1 Cthe_2314 family HEPN domain-containing protein [Devosia rhodophyticola]
MPDSLDPAQSKPAKGKRARTKPLVRYVLPSDNHDFIGRVYDLSIVALNFDSFEEMAQYPDVKYALEVNYALKGLTRRVESLNLAGGLIWPERLPESFKDFAVSRYEWLTIAADVFLMRYTSVVDCALILANNVYECELEPRKCSFDQLKKKGVSPAALSILEEMLADQGNLRTERNARFHHGEERGFTEDSQTFQMAARFEQWGNGLRGKNKHGRSINVSRSFKEGLVELQREFNVSTKSIVKRLDQFYDILEIEFESRFGPRICAATHGLNARSRD